MLAYTYVEKGKFELREKPLPVLQEARDAIVRVTMASICTSDLHIKHGSVPRAVPGITVGHEMVGVVEAVGSEVTNVKPGDRVTVNVETFCGECFFCKKGFVNNCIDVNGGWALGCRIDGGQAEYVRVTYADQGLNRIPDQVTDEQALFVGDILATGYWAARISEITEEDNVLIIGAGPTGICTLLSVMLKHPAAVIVCETDPYRLQFVREHYPQVLTAGPEELPELLKKQTAHRGADHPAAVIVCETDPYRLQFVREHYPQVLTAGPEELPELLKKQTAHRGADVVIEAAGGKETFRLAWQSARPNAVVTVVALYDEAQSLPLPDMYGKNLTFKTGGVDGCDCAQILELIAQGKIDTTPLITHTYPLSQIADAYELFENKQDHVIKVAIVPDR